MRKLLTILLLFFVICLSGCANAPAETDGSTTTPTMVTDPTHIYEEVREDFLIDAEVIGFPGNDAVTVYEVSPRVITEEQILNFLAANGDSLLEWKDYDHEYYNGCRGNTAYGGDISGRTSSTGLYPGDVSYSTPMTMRWNNCHIYPGQQFYEGNEIFSFAHLFTEPKDFTFATAHEAEIRIREMFAALGIDDLTLLRTFYIDHQILANEVTPILQTEEWQSRDKTGYIPTYDDWSEADDGYIFEFVLNLDGIPVVSQYFELDTYAYQGDTFCVWYQSTGVVWLNAHASLWNIEKTVKTVTDRLSAEEALNIARIRLENNKTATNTTVQKISAEYFYVMDGDRFLMRPAWVITAKVTTKYHFPTSEYISTKTNLHIIDAITGEELA